MIVDLNSDELPPLTGFDACICGAGPAGISIARSLAAKNWRVLLLEGGGKYYSKESQEIYDAESIGLEAWVNLTRQRQFGGTSNHWAGRCRPFEPSDFTREPPLDLPGWPITIDEIAGYQDAALEILDIETNGAFTHCKNPGLSEFLVADCDEESPPTRFSQKYQEELAASERITVLLNANATDVRTTPSGDAIDRVTFKRYDGTAHTAEAKVYVIAMGAVENARFLLNCTEDAAAGLGNEHGMVGAGFMEHFNVAFGKFLLANDSADFRMSLFTSDAFLESDPQVGRSNVMLKVLQQIKSHGRTAAIKTYLKKLACEWGVADELRFITEFDCPGTGLIKSLTEQFPSRSSRVDLGDTLDRFGLRQARLNWVMSAEDRESIRRIGIQVGKDFVDGGLGAAQLDPAVLDPKLPLKFNHHAHHMGTTRMAKRPEDGVVDENCKVFGLENLYVAGSSIFATGAACNPTMPLIQFALRLSDHVVERH